MDAPRHRDIPLSPPVLTQVLHAVMSLDNVSKLALVCVLFGWFFMKTLVVTLGSLSHGVRFFDMSAVIADPTRLFFDLDTPLHRFLFGLVCILCLAAPVAPHLSPKPAARWGNWAPLTLIAVAGLLLYWRSAGEFVAQPVDPKSLSATLARFANDLARHGGDMVARHVSVGAGGYLALIGAVVLAVQGRRSVGRRPVTA